MAELIQLAHHNRDPDALEIGELYRMARSSMVDGANHILEAGQRLIAKKAELARGQWLPWLRENADVLGFEAAWTAQRLMQTARKYHAGVVLDEPTALHISRSTWGHASNDGMRGTYGTGDNEWFTPPMYIEAARAALGRIDLDPATHAAAQDMVKAERFFTIADDGLASEWHGRVWLNPPYAREIIGLFIDKLLDEFAAGRTTAAIMLTHNYTDTEWFQTAAALAAAICFPLGRVRFIDINGQRAKPTQGQAFFYYGPNVPAFAGRFGPLGVVVTPYRERP